MASAKLDENGRASMVALLDSDGRTLVCVTANPSNNNGLSVDNGTTGSDNGGTYAKLDENSRPEAFAPALFALSSAGDGSLVAVYADSDGSLLIDSS